MATKIGLTIKKNVATLTRMGRPMLPDDERREKPLRIRMSDEERELVDRAAEATGQTTSQWARDILERAAKKQVGDEKRPKN